MLLSRVAESLYWINRYLERAENISRFVEVSEAMSLDCPPGSAEPWLPLIDASSDRESFDKRFPEKKPDDVINFLIRDRLNPNSIISCIQMARENARQIRDVMTTEIYTSIVVGSVRCV